MSPVRAPRLVPGHAAVFLSEKCKSVPEPREDRRCGPHLQRSSGVQGDHLADWVTTLLLMPGPDIVCNTAVMCNFTTFYSTLLLQRKWNENILLSTDLNYHLLSNTARHGMKGEISWFFYILWYSLWHLILSYWKSYPYGFEHSDK